jgi:hypothetical protein
MLETRINTAMSDSILPTSGWFPFQVLCKTRPSALALRPFVRAHVTRPPHPQKAVRAMNPVPLAPWGLSDYAYLTWRLFVIIFGMIALAVISKESSPQKHVTQTDETRPEIVTSLGRLTDIRPDPVEHAALVRKVHGKLRLLRLVVERLPQNFTPYAHVPEYRLTYYIETLECGHKVVSYPQCGPPTKRRNCGACALAASLPEKKPAVSVGDNEQEKQA